jgi:LL-diaminopimelate aminotransferase
MKINANYQNLQDSYLFSTIAKKVSEYQVKFPQNEVIRLGIGDVTMPLCEAVIEALHQAVEDMSQKETFHGYGPEQGYPFLKEAIRGYYQKKYQVSLESDEIFVSDGAKSDIGNILDLFSLQNAVLIPDPVYPVYVDTNLMAGRKILYMDATAENGFLPLPDPNVCADIIYLCSPNNPTGAVYSKDQLKQWVDYAIEQDAIILFDAAYEAFIQDESLPGSIYQIEGAKHCAIEFCSLSKTAGFTGTRCGYTVVPNELIREGKSLHQMWLRRQTTKFNGVPYIVQKGAAAVFSDEGQQQVRKTIGVYQKNAKIIADGMREMGLWFTGGENSPYIWLQCPNGLSSWDFFDLMLEKANVVGTPGAGFGKNGEGFFRLTAFNDLENTQKAVKRMKQLLIK